MCCYDNSKFQDFTEYEALENPDFSSESPIVMINANIPHLKR